MAIDLEQVEALQNGNPASLMQTLLEKSTSMDPRKLAVLEMLQKQAGRDEIPKQKYRRAMNTAKREIRFLETQLEDTLETLDMFADALGACRVCFGLNPGCTDCSGNGRPGAFDPDQELYDEWIRPAVQRSRKRLRRSGDSRHVPIRNGNGAKPEESEGG